jgi:solute carrier family 15 (peptide/histidine transporter), member 3/4
MVGFECLDSTASNGVANNLVVYLQTVLHGSTASNAANVTTWYGASYFVPIVAAAIADTYLGRYKIILLSLILYLIVGPVISLQHHSIFTCSLQNLKVQCISIAFSHNEK